VLGLPVGGDAQPVLALDGAEVRFEAVGGGRAEGLAEIAVELAPGQGITSEQRELGGVRLCRLVAR
jgi:hypothetical protein